MQVVKNSPQYQSLIFDKKIDLKEIMQQITNINERIDNFKLVYL